MSEPKGERLPQHVCLGPGPCPHEGCRKNREDEEEAWQYEQAAWEDEDRTREGEGG